MIKIACFYLAIAAAIPVWSQVQPSATGGGSYDLESEHMQTPPPVSRGGYPTTTGSEERSNFVSGGLIFTAAGTDNLAIGGPEKTPDATYSFLPNIDLNRKAPRDQESLNYSTGYTLYQINTQLNGWTQIASGSYRLNFSPYASLRISDTFLQDNSLYNQPNPFSGGGVSGSPGNGSGPPLIAPYANQLSNSSNAGFEYQYAKNSMIGASGNYSFLQYSGNTYIPQLTDQNTTTGNAFFSRRFGRSYAGVTYQFSKFITHPYGSYTVSDTIFGFYTHYFTRTFSISMLGGPEFYKYWTETTPDRTSAWTPAVQASIGWQVMRANLAANYSHVVAGAGGLIGTFHSDTGGLSCKFQLSRVWSTSAHVDVAHFANINTSIPTEFGNYPGGNSVFFGADLQRRIAASLTMQGGYSYMHQSYPGVTNTNSLENSNRGYISVSYHFNRPLGR